MWRPGLTLSGADAEAVGSFDSMEVDDDDGLTTDEDDNDDDDGNSSFTFFLRPPRGSQPFGGPRFF